MPESDLLRHPRFVRLSEKARTHLADLCLEYSFEAGDLVYFPDEQAEGPLLVVEGCLVWEKEGGEAQFIGVNEFWQVERFWRNRTVGGVLKGKTAGRYLVFPAARWVAWLRHHAKELETLAAFVGDPEGVWPLETIRAFGAPLPKAVRHYPHLLEPDETVRKRFRKSLWALFGRCLLPIFFALVSLGYGAFLQFAFGDRIAPSLLWLLPVAIALVSAGFAFVFFQEWAGSFLLVTDQAVIMKHLDLWNRRADFQKIPLDKIREAVFRKKGFVHYVFRLVRLELESDAKDRLVFDGLSANSEFLKSFSEFKQERLHTDDRKSFIRETLAKHFGGAKRPKRISGEPTVQTSSRRTRLSWREESEGVVRYRRHPWFLWKKGAKWVGLATLFLFLGFFTFVLVPREWGFEALVTGVALLFPLGRLAWDVADWTDDHLTIQGGKISLVHKRPLWLGETRQEGSLLQIQQIGIRKETISALFFDFGHLVISLGTDQPLTFEFASHPEWIQGEIFLRVQSLTKKNEQQAGSQRVEEVAEILETLEEARKQDFFGKSGA